MISDISIVSIILTILLVGVSLAGLILAVQIMMYKPLDDRRKEMSGRRKEEVSGRRQEIRDMRKEINDLRKEQANFREQVAGRLGKLEGLREFLTSRRAA